MTSEEDHKYDWERGPLVSVHCIGCSLPDLYGFANMVWPRITLFTKNLGILQVDDMIVLHSMVSNCWLRLFTLGLFSSLPNKYLFNKPKYIYLASTHHWWEGEIHPIPIIMIIFPLSSFNYYTLPFSNTIGQSFPTCGPRAACGPRGNTVRPAKSYSF